MHLDGAAHGAPVWLIFGWTQASISIFGGTVHPSPDSLVFPPTNAFGSVQLGPISGGGGTTTVLVQAARLYFALPMLISLSNAVQLDVEQIGCV